MNELNLIKDEPFYLALVDVCAKIIMMDGEPPRVYFQRTDYVLPGCTISLVDKNQKAYHFWVGMNGPRLTFIVFMANLDSMAAESFYEHCFAGAKRVGWEMHFESYGSGVSIWGNCMTERDRPLFEKKQGLEFARDVNGGLGVITDYGLFWARDIAMMAQSWVRTSQRNNLVCQEEYPCPL